MRQYRGYTKAGTLAVGEARFSTRPALYQFTPHEAEELRRKWGDRLVLEEMSDPEDEPEPAVASGSRRGRKAEAEG